MSFKSVSCRNDSVVLTYKQTWVQPEQEVAKTAKRTPTSPYSSIADPAVCIAAGIKDLQVKRIHPLLLLQLLCSPLEDVLDFSAVFTDTLTLKSPLFPCEVDNNLCVTTPALSQAW